MVTLKEKSDTNLKAALVLTADSTVCLSSVHCSYYSCFQLVIYYLETILKIDQEERKIRYERYRKGLKGTGATKTLGTHEYWIQQFVKDYQNRKSSEVVEIHRTLTLLKQARSKADYSKADFNKKQTDEIYDLARNLRIKIIKTYEP